MIRRRKDDNWKWTVKFSEDDPIAHYTYTSGGIPQGYEEFWKFLDAVGNTRKLIGFTVERIVKPITKNKECKT